MAADEYYDSVGQVLAYVLSSTDRIERQGLRRNGLNFYIKRDGFSLELYCPPDRRYFSLIYDHRISNMLKAMYKNDSQVLNGHMERYDIEDDMLRNENLDDIVSYHRIRDISDDEVNKLYQNIRDYSIHSDCRIRDIKMRDPRKEDDDDKNEEWDGLQIIGLLYPYEEEFNPRRYERAAQEVISVAEQVGDQIKRLDVLEEVGY